MLKYLTFVMTLLICPLTYACNNDTMWEEALRQYYAKKGNFCLKQILDEINNAEKFIFLTPDQQKLRSSLSKKALENADFSKLPCTFCFNQGKENFYQGEPSLRTHLFKHSNIPEERREALKQAFSIAATIYNTQTIQSMKYNKK